MKLSLLNGKYTISEGNAIVSSHEDYAEAVSAFNARITPEDGYNVPDYDSEEFSGYPLPDYHGNNPFEYCLPDDKDNADLVLDNPFVVDWEDLIEEIGYCEE